MLAQALAIRPSTQSLTCRVLKPCFNLAKNERFHVALKAKPKNKNLIIADVGGLVTIAKVKKDRIVLPDRSEHWIYEVVGVIKRIRNRYQL